MRNAKKTKVATVPTPMVNGLTAREVKLIRAALRQIWYRGASAKAVKKRCALPGDYFRCEGCKKKVPKIHVDHIEKVGLVDSGFIKRLFCPPERLRGLCVPCHALKTRDERTQDRLKQLLGEA